MQREGHKSRTTQRESRCQHRIVRTPLNIVAREENQKKIYLFELSYFSYWIILLPHGAGK
jgi:hypothetical protein